MQTHSSACHTSLWSFYPKWISEAVICSLTQKVCNIYRVYCKCHNHQQREVASNFFYLKKTNHATKQHQNQLCCSLTVFRRADTIAFTCSMYSRDFQTGVENPSEEWYSPDLSYTLSPQTLTGNLWGEYETTMWRREHSLLYLSPSILTNSQHWHLAALADGVTQELSRLSWRPGTKAGGVKRNCCLALTVDAPNHLRSCYTSNTVNSTLTLSCTPSSSCTGSGLPRKHAKKYLRVPMSGPAPISVDYNFWKVEQP